MRFHRAANDNRQGTWCGMVFEPRQVLAEITKMLAAGIDPATGRKR